MHPTLWHYTCEHGRRSIGDAGHLLPGAAHANHDVLLPWTSRFVWLTDLEEPVRDALGLTAHSLRCDRTEHRYRVTDDSNVARWMTARRVFRKGAARFLIDQLESAPGAAPVHWWIAMKPVPAVLDPLGPHPHV